MPSTPPAKRASQDLVDARPLKQQKTGIISSSFTLFLPVRRLSLLARLLTRGFPLAAGFDLCAALNAEAPVTIPPHGKAVTPTDLSMELDRIPGGYGTTASRSELAWKQSMGVRAGVIDADYRENVGLVLFNHVLERDVDLLSQVFVVCLTIQNWLPALQ